ncbi:toll/interleukin-1 receptor domain-containing protein [Gemmatimonas sp.]|uniref:toll/interleukin-1 receptor domain-containing protein n=1 Tax=Gemmatimonas sp. TaxID=1962908 RepID=UPI003341E7A5
MTAIPTTFISYSWDDDAHKAWVRDLASRLRGDGIDVVLDQWHTAPGDQLPAFMESAIRENQFVLIICTPGYKRRSDERKGGVGYEGDIITGEVATQRNHRKFIPLLRVGEWLLSAPSWVSGKYFIDLRGDPYSQAHYADLVATLHGDRPKAPPLGSNPTRNAHVISAPLVTPSSSGTHWEPLKITGVIADKVSTPRMDGSRGSALYHVPFRLSRRPPAGWDELFVQSWNRPPEFTSMHRPRIASVEGDVIWLRGTTLEEVERYHRDTLRLAVDQANRIYGEHLREHQARRQAELERERQHMQSVQDAARRISFD